MDLQTFIRAVRRQRVTFALVTAVVFILGVTAIVLFPTKFTSSTRLLVSIEGSTTAQAYQNEEVANRRIRSYIPLVTSSVVTQRVIDKLHLPMTPDELAAQITATNVPIKSALIDIEVFDGSAQRAQQIATTVADEFIRYAAAIETPTGEDSQKIHTTLVSPATEGQTNRLQQFLLGLLAAATALLIAAGVVWIRTARESVSAATEQPIGAETTSGEDADHARHRAPEETGADQDSPE